MAETKLLQEPYNPIDPIVVFDPTFDEKYVLKQYDISQERTTSQSSHSNTLKDDAINIPVVKLNNITLKDDQIDFIEIMYDSFLPTIHLSIKDNENLIRTLDTPGFDNDILVVITAEINGYYKKIKLQFYITEFNIFDDYISYHGVYNLKALNNSVFKQIGDKKLSTYELLENIAKESKLGFAASSDCKDIKDEKYRIIRSQNYIDFIDYQMKFAGTDEKSIFDCWIDLFGYLVLMNVYRAMNEKVEQNQLAINSMVGTHMTTETGSEVEGIQLQRTLTNNIINENKYNLLFSKYNNIIDNNTIYDDGSLNQVYYMTSPGNENKISTSEIQIIENSVNGIQYSEEYEFKNVIFAGIEFEDEDVLFKKRINKRFFDKLRARRLEIEMENYNIGLERGMLVNVIFKEYNNNVIQAMSEEELVDADTDGMVNPYSTGMYYIDGMKFVYKTEDHKIVQYLYLVKRGSNTNPINKSIEPPLANKENE